MSATSTLVPLSSEYQPFDTAEIGVTLRGRKRHTIHAQADFDTDAQARRALEKVRASLVAGKWLERSTGDAHGGLSLYSEAAAIDEDDPKGLVADLFTLGTRLYFSCSDAALKMEGQREAIVPPAQ